MPIQYWLEIALMYYGKGQFDQFSLLLSSALESRGDPEYNYLCKDEHHTIKAINVFASH